MRITMRAALLAAACLPGATLAQTATKGVPPQSTEPQPGDATTQATSPNGAGDIVVTARKQEERLQDVPIAITAFDAKEIQSARIESLQDVAKLTPGLNYTPLFGRQNQLPIIRGAAQTFGQLNVGVFLDGIYLSGKGGVDLELNDLERVEVIKGPQSALYGRNTFAGAINYVTKRPTAELSSRASIEAAEQNTYKSTLTISGPLADTLRFRVGGFARRSDGFYRSAIDGGRVDYDRSYGGLATLEWQPSDALTFTLRGSYTKEHLGQPASSVIRNNTGLGIPSGGVATQPRNLLYVGEVPAIGRDGVTVNTRPVPGLPGGDYGDREEAIRVSGTLEYDMGTVLATAITSFDKRNAEYTFDGDNTICDRTGGCPNFGFPFAPAIPIGSSGFALSSNDGYLRDVSQELRFQSVKGGRFDWLFGLYYYDNINTGVDRGFSPLTTTGATAYRSFNTNYSYPEIRLTTKSYAVFGSATFHATDRFDITGELRYEYEKQTFNQCPTYLANPQPAFTGVLTQAQIYAQALAQAGLACGATLSPQAATAALPFTGGVTVFPSPLVADPATTFYATRQSFRFATPRVILNYKATDDVLLYASYARGAKTGGFNTGLNVFPNQRAYEPEHSDNYELGLKTDLFDRRLRFNAAGFYINWTDQQAACQNPVTAGGSSTNRTYTCNVAASRIYGVETDVVARFSDFFTLSANYAYTHARYRTFVDDSLAATLLLAGLPALDFNGKHLPYVPDHKLVVTPRFNVSVGEDASIEARADVQYQSRTYLRADNFQNFGEKTLVDLRLTGRFDRYSLQLFANNVFDNDRPLAGVRFFDSVNFSVSSPLITGAPRRRLGAAFGYAF